MKNQKGITLVALIITIIVMLILAGVSISLVVGDNGVLTQAQNTKYTQEKAELEQAVQLAMTDLLMDYYKNTTGHDTVFTDANLLAAIKDNTSALTEANIAVKADSGLANAASNKYIIITYKGLDNKDYECKIDLTVDASGNVKTPYQAKKVSETASGF